MGKEYILNSLLWFLTFSQDDYSIETLKSLSYSFYSLETNKTAKALLSKLLSKNQVERRDTLKNLKVDFVDLDRKFSCAVKGME